MFDANYTEWTYKRIKFIMDHFGYPFFRNKKILDLGCGHGDVGASFYRLGADVTCVDIRDDNLQITTKKYQGIKTKRANLDREWPFDKVDVIMDLGLLCHLFNYEAHLKNACRSTNILILETAVCDSDDPELCIMGSEDPHAKDKSFSGTSSRPTAAKIEKILINAGMNFKRMDTNKLNSKDHIYDWSVSNSNNIDIGKRRLWIANKIKDDAEKPSVYSNLPVTFSPPIQKTYSTIVQPQYPAPTASSLNKIVPMSYYPLDGKEKRFVIVIPSYNNERWCERNIQSALEQHYDRYRVIFTDDCSSDDTFNRVSAIVNASPQKNKCTLIKNTERLGALANLYNMIHSCSDDEIILTLDGDDWLGGPAVLNILRNHYVNEDIWMTYGQYKNSTDGGIGVAKAYPPNIINENGFRHHAWGASHLRTFYTWLFKKIKKEDLYYEGKFMPMTWDLGIMYPMMEMSGPHQKYVSDILYIYNLENPINDHKVNVSLQQAIDHYMRIGPKYSRCEKPIIAPFLESKVEIILPEIKVPETKSVGLMLIATGKYYTFLQGIIASADKYFLNENCDVTYYVFSDNQNMIHSSRNVVFLPIEHKPFPYASMDRFKHFTRYADKLGKEDYLYYVDVDCLFVDNISSNEIFGNLVGVRHCGFINSIGTFETNQQSVLYVGDDYPKKYKYYFGGGFSGGKSENYLQLAQWCNEMIARDLSHDIMPLWHDETALNRYFLDNEPDVILTPSFHYPQGDIERYKREWLPQTFDPKILLLDKNHMEIRS